MTSASDWCKIALSRSNHGKTEVTQLYSYYPFRLIQQSPWKSFVCMVAVGFGGGLVQGDIINLNIDLQNGAEACFKTQGSTKVFKCASERVCLQNLIITIEHKSLLVYIPDPIVCFNEAKYKQSVRLNLDLESSVVFVDCFSSGRLGRDDFWGAHCIHNSLNVYLDDNLIVSENQRLSHDSTAGSIAVRVGHYHVFGVILLFGSRTAAVRQRLEALKGRQFFHQKRIEILSRKDNAIGATRMHHHQLQEASMVSVTSVAGCSNCIVRFLCCSAEEMFELLREILLPMSCELRGLDAYSDRCLNERESGVGDIEEWPPGHPVRLLRAYDATHRRNDT